MKTGKLTTLALFTTIALIIYSVESMLPPLVPIPGIKLGLANVVTLVVLQNDSVKSTLLVLLARILLSTFFFGQAMSLMYSLAGGLLCLLVMALSHKLLRGRYTFITSIFGALSHNLGQLIVALLLTAVPGVLVYCPFLMLSGIITGLFTGLCAHFIQRYLMPVIKL